MCTFPGGRNENDQDICRLKEEMGYCHAYMERFFFDINKKECRRFAKTKSITDHALN